MGDAKILTCSLEMFLKTESARQGYTLDKFIKRHDIMIEEVFLIRLAENPHNVKDYVGAISYARLHANQNKMAAITDFQVYKETDTYVPAFTVLGTGVKYTK